MSRRIPAEIVAYLSLRPGKDSPREFPRATARDWKYALKWLDLSGLALYFLQRVSENNALSRLPRDIAEELERRRSENEMRTAAMRETFGVVNRAFENAHVPYTVLKGFSLVPDYCPEASLRTQADFDYLIENESLEQAQSVLARLGYVLKGQEKEDELFFWIPKSGPSDSHNQYSPRTPWILELHLACWDQKVLPLPGIARREFVDGMTMRQCNGLRFASLGAREMFLAQVLHVFRHLLDGWIKLAWLFELGYFLTAHAADGTFWSEFSLLIDREPQLAEVTAMVCRMSEELFHASTPPLIQEWKREIRPLACLWLEKYSREFLFQNIPRFDLTFTSSSKLVFLLQEQYLPDAQTSANLRGRLLFPWHRLRRGNLLRTEPKASLRKRATRKARRLGYRVLYHLGANIRYWWELPRWRRLVKRQSDLSRGG